MPDSVALGMQRVEERNLVLTRTGGVQAAGVIRGERRMQYSSRHGPVGAGACARGEATPRNSAHGRR